MTRGEGPAAAGAPRIRVAIRYDDFSNGSPDGLDRFLVETARGASVPITVAVVPFGWGPPDSRPGEAPARPEGPASGLTAEKADVLGPGLRDGSVSLAQHGFDHVSLVRADRGFPTEFSGRTEAEQLERMARGLEILEDVTGVRPRTFVPPWNRYDDATIKALGALDFSVLSAGRHVPPVRGRGSGSQLAFVPTTATPLELRPQILAAREAREPRVIVGLLHPYDFAESGSRWGRVERGEWSDLMDWIGEQDDVDALTLAELAELEPDLGAQRLDAYARYHADPVRRVIPASWPGSLDRSLSWYPERAATRALARRRAGLASALWVSIIGAAGALGAGLEKVVADSAALRLGLRYGLIAAVLPLAIRAFRGDGPYFRGILVTVVAMALAVGFWLG